MTGKIIASIEAQWVRRAKTQQLKYGSLAYKKLEWEFFTGAMSALVAIAQNTPKDFETMPVKTKEDSAMVPTWIIGVMRGEPIISKENFNK